MGIIRFSRVVAFPIVLALVLAGCTGPRSVSDKDIDTIDLEGVLTLVQKQERKPNKKKLLLIDSRSQRRFETSHIAGARNILLSAVNPDLGRDPSISAYDEIIVYADNPGSASAKAMVKRMLRMRYDDVRLFPGGLEAWRAAGLPVAGTE